MRIKCLSLIAALLAALVGMSPDAADAFPVASGVDCTVSSDIDYHIDPAVPAVERARIVAGLERWEDFDDVDGLPFVTVDEGTLASHNVRVDWDSSVSGLAAASCENPNNTGNFGVIRIHPTPTSGSWSTRLGVLEGVASHELGHLFNIGHSGTHDELRFGVENSSEPFSVLSTCLSPTAERAFLGDDLAALAHKRSTATGGFGAGGGPASPNLSFEEGLAHCFSSGHSGLNHYTVDSGGIGNTNHMRFKHNPGGGHVLVESRLTAGWGKDVGGTVSIKDPTTGLVGEVTIQTWYRGVIHDTGDTNCYYPHQQNDPSIDPNKARVGQGAWLVHLQNTCFPNSSAFVNCKTGTTQIGSSYVSLDMQIKLYSSVRTAGSSAYDPAARRHVMVDDAFLWVED